MNPRMLLQRELERRCQSNPRYSLRAFARALEMSPTVVSLVLNGKRPLSRKAARRLSEALPLTHEENQSLNRWADARKNRVLVIPEAEPETDAQELSLDTFALISEWYHYAILSLLEVRGARFEARWISRHLGITEMEAKGAIDRLVRMGFVAKKNGRWKQSKGPIRISDYRPTAATHKFQKQLLGKAIEAMENVPAETRDLSSITFALNPAHIPYARERIQKFRRDLVRELESRGSPKLVYNLTVQIFPVSRPVEEREGLL